MTDENMTLYIDPDSRDLVIDDEDGHMGRVFGDDTTKQAVRLTLQTWMGEFFLDTGHGTEYDRILGKKPYELQEDEIDEVIRAAIFQEVEVSHIDTMDTEVANKTISTAFAATLYSGNTISMEVTA